MNNHCSSGRGYLHLLVKRKCNTRHAIRLTRPHMDRGALPRRNRPIPSTTKSRPPPLTTRGRRRPTNARPPPSRRTSPPVTPSSSSPSATCPPPPPPRSRPSRAKHRHRQRRFAPPEPSVAVKLVVRRLPPTLSATQFADVADEKGASSAVWRSYYPGSVEAIGPVKRTPHVVRHSVAYLAFVSMEDATKFCGAMNGYCFAEGSLTTTSSPSAKPVGTSSQYIACVERSLCQSTPPLRRRAPPPVQGTLEQDTDYQAFLKALENGDAFPAPGSTSFTQSATSSLASEKDASVDDKKPKSSSKVQVVTPLMEVVRQRRKEKDQKKKASKPVARTIRPKVPQIHVVDHAKTPIEPTKINGRRKKRRGADIPVTSRKGEAPKIVERRGGTSGKPIAHGRVQNSYIRHDDVNNKITSSATLTSKASSSFVKNSSNVLAEGQDSSVINDGVTGRSRYGRAPRIKGNKYNSSANGVLSNGVGNDSPTKAESLHGSVRLLKKEASNVNKT